VIGYHGGRLKEEMMTTRHSRYTVEETVRRGKESYERENRAKVEAGNKGKTLVIDVDTGDYEINDDSGEATRRLLARHPDAPLYRMRIGYPAFGKIGGSWGAAQ
jgi:hypothetical protein